ncbi:MAG: hypothetical protein HC888_07795 [Candidatus Competibacteraceae bacterium]|nr:hypothetical protein [Candidatus Competibacteraceae bacterium]
MGKLALICAITYYSPIHVFDNNSKFIDTSSGFTKLNQANFHPLRRLIQGKPIIQ